MSLTTSIYIYGLLITYGIYAALKVKNCVHMLQQNSYRNERYVKWMKENRWRVYRMRDLLPLLSIGLFIYGTKLNAILSFVLFYLLLIFLRDRTPNKKPLVITARVKRLFITSALLYAGIFATVIVFLGTTKAMGIYVVPILTLSIFFVYDVARIANLINLPMEKKISRGYVEDAKRIVKEMGNLKVIGITGSYGKTSVKHILNTVLSSKYNTLMTPESYNTPMGVTLTIRNHLKPIHEVFIAEMGAKQTGDIKEICEIVHQKYAILTAVGPQHLETFGSIENVQKTKFEIIETLPEDGVGFVNIDDENIKSYKLANNCKVVSYGIESVDADIRAEEIMYGPNGASFTVTTKSGEHATFQTKLLGKHNIYNILSAIAVGKEMGLSLDKMVPAIRKVQPVKHRLEIKKRDGGVTIIDDAFNSNPTGSKMALEVLGNMPGKKILVTPGMIELGVKEYELNKAFGMHAAKVCDYIVLVGKKQTQPIQDALKESGYSEEKYSVVPNLNEGIQVVNRVVEPNSFVLFENDLPDTFNEK